jgi:small subunit ribosomal protein S9
MPTKSATKKPAIKKTVAKKPAVKKAALKKAVAPKPASLAKRGEHVAVKHVASVAPSAPAVAAAVQSREKYQATVGKRKTAIARVRYYKLGTGEIVVNGMTLEKYFSYMPWVEEARSPLGKTGWTQGRWSIKAQGGGKHAQAHAVRHGIARMLILLDPALRPVVKPLGFLTRDARVKERKKYGLKRARRAPQWQKR